MKTENRKQSKQYSLQNWNLSIFLNKCSTLFYYWYRSVPDNQRSFALGIQFLIMRSLSFLPGPIIMGSVVDSQCTAWMFDKCGNKLNCADYDVDTLSRNLVIFSITVSSKCDRLIVLWKIVTAWKVSKYGVISSLVFPVLGLNTDIYSVNLLAQSEYRKIQTKNNSILDTFYTNKA